MEQVLRIIKIVIMICCALSQAYAKPLPANTTQTDGNSRTITNSQNMNCINTPYLIQSLNLQLIQSNDNIFLFRQSDLLNVFPFMHFTNTVTINKNELIYKIINIKKSI